ncbi:MAG: aldehyde ferredoxin oxidoreductase N-terminal domain-containing protein, partial [Planctomycetota bacterium]
MASRVLSLDLGALERGLSAEAPREFGGKAATLASFGGSALGLAELLRAAVDQPAAPPPFVVAVGEAVRDGLATAARAALLARAPLSGLFAEGHVGGELGARLARSLDALVLRGRKELAGAVLVLTEDGQPALVSRPALRGLSAGETNRRLAQEFAPASVLSIGPAGERGVALASLASGDAPPSFVGRGGLGAAFGALGLKALVVRGVPGSRAGDEGELARRLARSPRLAARARGGTLERFAAAAARG